MGHGHSHGHDGLPPTPEAAATRRRANILLIAIIVPLTLATVLGMIALWPSGEYKDASVGNPYATVAGVSFETGEVIGTSTAPCVTFQAPAQENGRPAAIDCLSVEVKPDRGGDAVSFEIQPEVTASARAEVGDRIRFVDLGETSGAPAASRYSFVDFIRTTPMALLAIIYAIVVVAIARWRGFRALLGLGGAYAVLALFILPGLIEGKPPLLLALIGSSVIMIGVLYFAHGFSARTSTALLGTIFGLVATALIATWATDATHLTGLNDESDYSLYYASGSISISGIILTGLIISGLGVLNDVTITQSSAVWEMYELAPESSARRLFTGAMRIGRDHIASTVYTIAFAYAGAALPVLILTSLQDRPMEQIITSGELAEEIVRTLVGSIGLVLAIPVTTIIAVMVVKAVGSKNVVRRDQASALPSTRPDATASENRA